MITPKSFLNCYELDEWYQLMEDRAYDDIANNDDVELDDDDDEFIKQTSTLRHSTNGNYQPTIHT